MFVSSSSGEQKKPETNLDSGTSTDQTPIIDTVTKETPKPSDKPTTTSKASKVEVISVEILDDSSKRINIQDIFSNCVPISRTETIDKIAAPRTIPKVTVWVLKIAAFPLLQKVLSRKNLLIRVKRTLKKLKM